MTITPNPIARLLGRTEPKPPDPEIPTYRWTPRPDVAFTLDDAYREADILDRPADLTAQRPSPRDAALELFGTTP